jgi:hypothetical protein
MDPQARAIFEVILVRAIGVRPIAGKSIVEAVVAHGSLLPYECVCAPSLDICIPPLARRLIRLRVSAESDTPKILIGNRGKQRLQT